MLQTRRRGNPYAEMLSGKGDRLGFANDMTQTLLAPPLANLHAEHNARLVKFAGWEMPLQYTGIIAEHNHTRTAASLFDVSHMCQFKLRGEGVRDFIDQVLPVTSSKIQPGRNKYTFACNEAGGILDDLIIGNDGGEEFFVVCNASRAQVVLAHIRTLLPSEVELVQLEGQGLLAIQGPMAEQVVSKIFPSVADLYFMDSIFAEFAGEHCRICRSGYTGEDGFEISVPSAGVHELAATLLADDACQFAGLGARDTLRLEAGLCLYGNELSVSNSPVETGLTWAIPPSARKNKNFLGADVICQQLEHGCEQTLVAFTVEGRAPVRNGTELFVDEQAIGVVTSGAFSPTLQQPIGLALVAKEHATVDTKLVAKLRGRDITCTVAAMPLVPHNYRIRPRKPKS